ncbi:glyoxalase bleomycin resistance dioxygenase superfamily [Trichoderma arundinaceum]|uniref:Glyoxalase bleomycin resistance dioxygenase superfamily n=1 Tax=Trichoderma arundinaceum TaxID=490622 RepID=A0A395N9F6_TRIAR|nr:glyoxalase bleomycin resistance dioxygenase superfamily [Trichoderma arundinaceum]
MASKSTPESVFDHVILLIPYSQLSSPPKWLSDAFTILDGGLHEGGMTENKLVIFQDGVYLELIAFVDGLSPQHRAMHPWGKQPDGHIIHWAHTILSREEEEGSNTSEERFRAVQSRIQDSQVGIRYLDPDPGFRTMADGSKRIWANAIPNFDNHKGPIYVNQQPFWTFDRTPRPLRAPVTPENTSHPSGVVGVAGISLFIKDKQALDNMVPFYNAIFNKPAIKESPSDSVTRYKWEAASPSHEEFGKRHFFLYHGVNDAFTEEEMAEANGAVPEIFIKLSLYTKGKAGSVKGMLVEGTLITFELIPTISS